MWSDGIGVSVCALCAGGIGVSVLCVRGYRCMFDYYC